MTEWKPGAVAVATVRGVPNVRVIRRATGWASAVEIDGRRVFHPDRIAAVTDIRPLVVLDLPDRYRSHAEWAAEFRRPRTHNYLADEIEQRARPPKPAEPQGLGAVVEDADGVPWVRIHDDPGSPGSKPARWIDTTDQTRVRARYRDIDAVRVLSEGVQS